MSGYPETEIDLDFLEDAKINPEALDLEWLGQASLRFKYGRAYAQAAFNRDKAKEAARVAKDRIKKAAAEAELEIRAAPERFNLTSPKEATFAAATLLHPLYLTAVEEHQVAEQKVIEEEYIARLIFAALPALDDRSKGLQYLVDMDRRNYFTHRDHLQEPELVQEGRTQAKILQDSLLAKRLKQTASKTIYAIGPPDQVGAYYLGPFNQLSEAEENPGSNIGDIIFRVEENLEPKPVKVWKNNVRGDGDWFPVELRKHPENIPVTKKPLRKPAK